MHFYRLGKYLGDGQCVKALLSEAYNQGLLTVSLMIEGLQGDTCDKNTHIVFLRKSDPC